MKPDRAHVRCLAVAPLLTFVARIAMAAELVVDGHLDESICFSAQPISAFVTTQRLTRNSPQASTAGPLMALHDGLAAMRCRPS